jgi:predicted RNA polymerase sigma factor
MTKPQSTITRARRGDAGVGRDVRLAEYQPYWAARAELLAKTGAQDEARHAYEVAIGLDRDPAVQRRAG